MPPDLQNWLAERQLLHHVSDLVGGLDLTTFDTSYEEGSREME